MEGENNTSNVIEILYLLSGVEVDHIEVRQYKNMPNTSFHERIEYGKDLARAAFREGVAVIDADGKRCVVYPPTTIRKIVITDK